MRDEEESMELSGSDTSNLSILHNLSLDVPYMSRDTSPQIKRRQTLPPNFGSSPVPVSRPWKSLKLPVSPAPLPHTVRVSQKTIGRSCYSAVEMLDRHSYSPFSHVESQTRVNQSHSPMELDSSSQSPGSRFTSIKHREADNEKNGRSDAASTVTRHSMSTIRALQYNASELSDCEDDVIDSKSSASTLKVSSSSRRRCNKDKTGCGQSKGKSSGKKKSENAVNTGGTSFVGVILAVVFVSVCIGAYLFTQLGPCSTLEVDLIELEDKLLNNVFGQHIAIKTVVKALEAFSAGVKDGSGKRTLVLSFHGWTGVGKNYISKFITEAFTHSRVFWYLASLHFPHRNHDGKSVGSVIESWITGNITACGVNMFIIDEMDKADDDLISGIMAFIEGVRRPNTSVDRDRNSSPITVIVFLSNSRAAQINQYVFSQTLVDRERDLMAAEEFTDIFQQSSQEWYERLKNKGAIDYFVPFLPLAEEHVRKCIIKDLMRKGRTPTDTLIKAVMDELSFFDMGGKAGQVSLTGCKRVQDKVDLHIH